MFLYPERARKDRTLPKNKIYGNAQPSRAMRQRFVTEIDQIIWRFVLGSENLNLPARIGVEEIQVFEIALKTGQLKEDVLRTIDRAIPSLIFFELTFQGQVRFAAAYKRPPVSAAGEAIAGPPVVEAYFETPWQSSMAPRLPLPVAVDLGGLYEQMLRQHMVSSPLGLRPRAGESLAQTVDRGTQIRTLRRECHRLEAALRKEPQFNRKVAVNARLRELTQSLTDLESID